MDLLVFLSIVVLRQNRNVVLICHSEAVFWIECRINASVNRLRLVRLGQGLLLTKMIDVVEAVLPNPFHFEFCFYGTH